MTESTDVEERGTQQRPDGEELTPRPQPSNPVHARVGDTVLRTARSGVRRGLRPQEIIREIAVEHDVLVNLGELRLLLAARHRPEKAYPQRWANATSAEEPTGDESER